MQREIHISVEFFSTKIKKPCIKEIHFESTSQNFFKLRFYFHQKCDNSHLPIAYQKSPCKYLQHLTPMTALEPSS